MTVSLAAHAQETEEPPAQAPSTGLKQTIANLFDAESGEAFDNAFAKAKAAGASEQTLLEARFLNLINQRDNKGIAALSPELLARKDSFKVADSQIFGVIEEWQAVVHYSQALAALEKSDQAGFKTHIQEAFWLSPRQASIFAPHIEQLRLEEAMTKVRVDLNKHFTEQSTGKNVSLGGLADKSPLILLHFWSPWSQECEELIPDFIATATELNSKSVSIVSILADSAPEILPDANSYRENVNKKIAGFWIFDDQKDPLIALLRIPALPTMVLVNRSGKVLFNGHPSDDRLWKILQKQIPTIKRPDLPSE